MAATITLVVDDKTAAGFQSAVKNAEGSAARMEKLTAAQEERAILAFRRENQLAKNRKEAVKDQESSAAAIGKWAAGAVAAFLTFESLKKVISQIEQATANVVAENEKLGRVDQRVKDLHDAYQSVSLAMKDVLRQTTDINEATASTGRLGREFANIWGNAKEAVGFILSGKFKEQLASEEATRLGKLLVAQVEQQARIQRDIGDLQDLSTTELAKQEALLRKGLQHAGAYGFNQTQQAAMAQKLAAIEQLKLQRLQKQRDEQMRLAEFAGQQFEKDFANEQRLADFRDEVAMRERQIGQQTAARMADTRRQQEQDDVKRLTLEERMRNNQLGQDAAQIDAAERLKKVLDQQHDAALKEFRAAERTLKTEREKIKTAEDLEKNSKRLADLENDRNRAANTANQLAEKRKQTTREIAELERAATINRLKEAEADREAFREKQRQRDDALAGQLGQRGTVQQAAQRLDPRQVAQQIARDRAAQVGSTASAQMAGVRRDLQAGRISAVELRNAQANLLHQAVQNAVGQGKLNEAQATGFQKAVIALKNQADDVDNLSQTVDGLVKTIDAITNNRRARRQQAGGRP